MLSYFSGVYSLDIPDSPETFYYAGRAFGKFVRDMADVSAEDIAVVIPNFHNTRSRYEDLESAIARDPVGRAAKVEKEMRNTITRRVNCDSANADKVVSAAQEQIDAIRRIVKEYGLDALPEPLKDTALLRIANPEASLADLARLSYPPVSKSCLSHRLKKIMSFEGKEE